MCAASRGAWRRLEPVDGCLRLVLTLPAGQAFRWVDMGPVGGAREWAGVVDRALIVLRQAEPEPPQGVEDPVLWRLVAGGSGVDLDAVLTNYFRVALDLRPIVAGFCDADPHFNHVFPFLKGARLLRQSPVENLFSFICSSNNNIKRITGMVNHLAERYGEPVGEHGGREFFAFPSVKALTAATEEDLRDAGFGYRAKYIVGTARMLQDVASAAGVTPEAHLERLRACSRTQVAEELVQFPGVGRKVAGCVALMSMDQLGEIPVDTHVWQIAQRYMPALRSKTLTDRVYLAVGDFFREKFGEQYAGFAHNVLFIAELSDFKNRVPSSANAKEGSRKVKRALALKDEGTLVVKIEPSLPRVPRVQRAKSEPVPFTEGPHVDKKVVQQKRSAPSRPNRDKRARARRARNDDSLRDRDS